MAVLTLDRWNLAIGAGKPLVAIAGLNVLEDLGLEETWYTRLVDPAP